MSSGHHLGLWRKELEGEVVPIFRYRCDFVRDLLHLSLEFSRLEVWRVVVDIILVMLWLCREDGCERTKSVRKNPSPDFRFSRSQVWRIEEIHNVIYMKRI